MLIFRLVPPFQDLFEFSSHLIPALPEAGSDLILNKMRDGKLVILGPGDLFM
jgi:hypothetical protein